MAAKRKTYAKFQCTECKEINYTVHKARPKVEGGVKLEMKKHCRTCRKHTLHKEGKK